MGAEQTLALAETLLLELHPELLEKLEVRISSIFDWLKSRGWQIFDLHGRQIARAEYCDRIHTFWTVCHRLKH